VTGTTHQFFTVKTVQQALDDLLPLITRFPPSQTIPSASARDRIVASAPHSPLDLPEFARSSMDGYAVIAADTFGATSSLPAYLTVTGVVPMGSRPDFRLQPGHAAEIYTGAMLPTGADAVVMIERTQALGDGEIEVMAPAAPGENVVQIGEDVAAGDAILPRGHRIRPQDIGGLLAVGITQIEVTARPRVALLSSGDELVQPEQTPAPGQIRDINAYVLASMFEGRGALASVAGIASDTFDDLYGRARAALDDADMLVLSAGSSVSVRDLTRDVINRLGTPGVIQHGLAVKPGKPTVLAVCDGKPVIGLPGNPVSAALVARQLVLPVIDHLLGAAPTRPSSIRATLTQNIASTTGREDSVPVRVITNADGTYGAEPVFGKSNLIYTLIQADGLVSIPLNSNGLRAGTEVTVYGL
jgi:molybdopterin molybdotransferase